MEHRNCNKDCSAFCDWKRGVPLVGSFWSVNETGSGQVSIVNAATTRFSDWEAITESIYELYEGSGGMPNNINPPADFYGFSNQVKHLKGVAF